jgi:hypothetical protein
MLQMEFEARKHLQVVEEQSSHVRTSRHTVRSNDISFVNHQQIRDVDKHE